VDVILSGCLQSPSGASDEKDAEYQKPYEVTAFHRKKHRHVNSGPLEKESNEPEMSYLIYASSFTEKPESLFTSKDRGHELVGLARRWQAGACLNGGGRATVQVRPAEVVSH
jgi:hypothetical protein